MHYKSRKKSNELLIMELLNRRRHLASNDRHHYFSLKKGYEGELLFDRLTKKLDCECLILNDLLLKVNNTTFQIDSLIITQGKVFIYEVKNFEGDYYYESDKLYKKPQLEVMNPLFQLNRTESLLRQLLLSLGYKPQIDAFIIFINPKFTLYQAPLDKTIILPTQLNQYMETLNKTPSKITEKHKKIADQLLALNNPDSPYKQIPSYDYDQLRKGITCLKCYSYSVTIEKRKCVCHDCGNKEPVTVAVLRSVQEFKLLFPNEKVTTNIVEEWCQVVPSKKSIRRILSSNFRMVGVHRWTSYE
ncbi:nuclease-related domain-containing protein [Oceanobacillus rekensis]|uniref:nuclease-related domain-containing protein n=1 Tax=Oceanobacillus rekensis TaxID=937927 RepID=UPI000B451037|nr:nuclease-related domain-containing protein [Oceanobacillus rekensis]